MCGGASNSKRVIPVKEIEYLNALVRGAYAKKKISKGTVIDKENFSKLFYMAIPLQKGQISVREIINGIEITKDLDQDEALLVTCISGPYSEDDALKKLILDRGL
jgi:N-acetylneuraminate synthase